MENKPISKAEPHTENVMEREITLESLLTDVSDVNRHGEIDFGKSEGVEEL